MTWEFRSPASKISRLEPELSEMERKNSLPFCSFTYRKAIPDQEWGKNPIREPSVQRSWANTSSTTSL